MSIPLLNTFCRLAATSANKVPRPSRCSLATATGSKRSSADSDSLLCHVGLWRTSRFRFGCASVCEHSEIKFALHNTHVTPHPPLSRSPFSHWRRLAKILAFVSACTGFTPAAPLYAGVQTMRARICSAFSCDMFARVVWLKLWGAAKLPAFALPCVAHTRHARLARLTRARGKRYQREGNALFDDFWYFSSRKSTIKEKVSLCFIAGENFDLNIKFAAKNKPRQCAADCFHYK